MAKGQPKVEIPKFKAPAKVGFDTPYGNVNFQNGNFVFGQDPQQEADMLEIQALRSSILKTIGVTSPEREASLNKFQETFFNESARVALPKLENTLFDRGLGGSSVYQGAVSDLLSQLATESVLQRENLSNQDETLKLNQLSQVGNQLGLDRNTTLSLLNLASGYNTNQQQLAQNLYSTTLPYTAQVTGNSGPSFGSILGSVAPLALSAINPASSLLSFAAKPLKPTSVTPIKP